MKPYVDRMILDRWVDLFCYEDEVVAPTIVEVENALRNLNAKTRTMISLHGGQDAYLTVGGGGGEYVVYKSANDERIWNLMCDSGNRSEVVLLNIGGQEGEFSANQVIDEDRMLQAARTFFWHGSIDPALCWEKQ